MLDSWRSIDLETRETFANVANPPPGQFSTYRADIRYVETAEGLRRLDHTLFADRRETPRISRDFFDGSRSANVYRPAQGDVEQVTIRRAFANEDSGLTHRATPLKEFFVGLRPLPDALTNSRWLGIGRHLDRDCDRFLFERTGKGSTLTDLVVWLDRTTSVPLKVERFHGEADRLAERPWAVWSARSLGETDGRTFAMRSDFVHFVDPSTPDKGATTYTTEVVSIKFDQDFPKSFFWPEIRKGTTVLDHIRGKVEVIGQPAVVVPPKGTEPLRAEAPSGGISTWMVLAALGAALFVAAVVVRRRQG